MLRHQRKKCENALDEIHKKCESLFMFEAEVTIHKARALIRQTKWSKHSLAIEAGLSPNALRSLDSDDCGATSKTLKKLSAALARISDREKIVMDALLKSEVSSDAA